MREESYQQFAIVQADSAKQLTELLNSKLKELKDKDPIVTFEGLIARIKYTEEFEVAEDWEDAWRMRGVSLTCSRCPNFEPNKKADGTTDMRSKKGMCSYNCKCRFADAPACEDLYQMINEGGIGLCLKKSED